MKIAKKIGKFMLARKKLFAALSFVAILIVILVPLLGRLRKAPVSATVERKDIAEELALSGKITAKESASLQFASGGLLTWVGVKEGVWVYKNQAVASLDTRLAKNSLQKSLNLYEKTRLDFDQLAFDYRNYQENSDKDYREKTARILRKSQLDLESSVLDVESQNIAIGLSTISTPISGIVTKVEPAFAGVNVSPFNALIEVVNPLSLYFEVTADQTEVVKINTGGAARIILDAFPEKEFLGKIESISFVPKAGEASTVYGVKVAVPDLQSKNQIYKLEMTGDATFILAEKSAVLTVPLKFIKTDTKGKYVLTGKKKVKTYIETGIENENDIEITKGLGEGEVVYD